MKCAPRSRSLWMGLFSMENVGGVVPNRRSQADKVGKHKHELALLHRLEHKLERIEKQQRIIFHGLQGYFRFDRPLVEEVGCAGELDLAVVSVIFESGSGGILAKGITSKLPQFSLEQHKILRIIKRVNVNVEKAFGRPIIEKRGKKWAFNSFGVAVWGKSRDDAEDTFTDSWEKGEVKGEE